LDTLSYYAWVRACLRARARSKVERAAQVAVITAFKLAHRN